MTNLNELFTTALIGVAFAGVVGAMDIAMAFAEALVMPVAIVMESTGQVAATAWKPFGSTLFPIMTIIAGFLWLRLTGWIIRAGGTPPYLLPNLTSKPEVTEVDRVKQRADVEAYIDGEIDVFELEDRLEDAWATEKGADASEEISKTAWERATDDEANPSEEAVTEQYELDDGTVMRVRMEGVPDDMEIEDQ